MILQTSHFNIVWYLAFQSRHNPNSFRADHIKVLYKHNWDLEFCFECDGFGILQRPAVCRYFRGLHMESVTDIFFSLLFVSFQAWFAAFKGIIEERDTPPPSHPLYVIRSSQLGPGWLWCPGSPRGATSRRPPASASSTRCNPSQLLLSV